MIDQQEQDEFAPIELTLLGGIKRLISEGMVEDESDARLLKLIIASGMASEPQKQWMTSVLERHGAKWRHAPVDDK